MPSTTFHSYLFTTYSSIVGHIFELEIITCIYASRASKIFPYKLGGRPLTVTMSASLFRSRQFRPKRNLKLLTILAPLGSRNPSSTPLPIIELATTHAVVLCMLFDFKAQLVNELLVSKGTYVKFCLRPGLGWLEVEQLNEAHSRGYVPALYVLIAINNELDPVTLEWLQATPATSSGEDSIDAASVTSSELFDFENFYPENIEIDRVVKTNRGFAFRLKLVMHKHDCLYIGKLATELEGLHAVLGLAHAVVPPFPTHANDSPAAYHAFVREVNHWWVQVLAARAVQRSQQLADFVALSVQVVQLALFTDAGCDRTLFGDEVEPVEAVLIPSNPVVSGQPSPVLEQDEVKTPIQDSFRHYLLGSELVFSRTMSLTLLTPAEDVTPDTPSTPPIDHNPPKLALAASVALRLLQELTSLPGPNPISGPRRSLRTKADAAEYIKIKIHLNNKEGDVIALKIKRTNLILVVYLKKLLSYKIYKDYSLIDHYTLQGLDQLVMGDEDLLVWLKCQRKAVLNLVRKRGRELDV